MKNIFKSKIMGRGLRFLAIAASFGFIIAGTLLSSSCGGGGLTGGTPPPETAFSVSGSFTKSGGGDVEFTLSDAASAGRSARAISAGSYAVSGELVDGGIIFRLTGTYDPVARSYTASTSSSMIRFSINGAFTASGVSLGSTATLLVNTNTVDEGGAPIWVATTYPITEEEVSITGTEAGAGDLPPSEAGGIPAFARGWWSYTQTHMGYRWDANVLLSEWTITQELIETDPEGRKEIQSFRSSVVEVTNHGSYYDVILGYPVYVANKAQAEAAATAFMTEYYLTAAYLAEPPDDGLGKYYWYVSEGGGGEFYLPPGIYEMIMGSLDGSPGILQNLQEALGRVPTREEFAVEIRKLLADNDIDADELDAPKVHQPWPEGPKYWYDPVRNDIVWADFAQNQWEIIMRWYNTNYLERYLIGLDVTPVTRYLRSRITFSQNNSVMTIADYGVRHVEGQNVWFDFECTTVAAAKALTQVDTENAFTITR